MKLQSYTDGLTRPSSLLIVFCICFSVFTMDLWRGWHFDQTNFVWDVANYYSYLPAKFCNDHSFEFRNGTEVYLPKAPGSELHMPKVTYGMSVLYAPFFALGYKIAINQKDPRDGFSEPFRTCIHWGSIFYGLLGLFFLRKFLLRFFSEWVTAFTLAACFFGTTLFYYTLGNSEMAHTYLFCLISAFLYASGKWHDERTWTRSLFIGSLLGLISLIRPTEILVASVFFLWGVKDLTSVKEQIRRLIASFPHLLLMLAVILLIWLPQFIFWKNWTGNYFFFSYGDERFFWDDPQIVNILFSYRKGWLTYSPLIWLVFAGFFFMKDQVAAFRPVILSLLIINVYMLSCWWDWFFGGGFGARGFTQHIAFLSLPLASFIRFTFESGFFTKWKEYLRLLIVAVLFSGMILSVGQSYQYAKGYIHFNAMCKEAYWFVYGRYYLDDKHSGEWWGKLNSPDYEKLRSGENRDQ